jgi:tetratricopeptide (TPR) repeat protein
MTTGAMNSRSARAARPRAPARGALLAMAIAAAFAAAPFGYGAGAQAAEPVRSAQPAPNAPDFAARRAAARAATERRDWADALPRWQALEAAAPADADLLIESARVHGFADRNAQAAERYRRVLELAPGRRGDVLLSLAWQTLWAGQPEAAEPLFAEVAARPSAYAGGGDGFDAWRGLAEARRNSGRLEPALEALGRAQALRPEDRDVARQAAQTHAWLDRHEEAAARYSALVASDPTDRWSRYGLAQSRNFQGLHRAAVADYREAFEADRAAGRAPPPDALFDHARALRWAGYDDLAHAALDGLSQPDARWLRDWRTGREQRRWASAAFEAATDRDELDTRATTASFGWRPGSASSAEVGARRVDLEEPGRSAHGERLGITLRTRIGADAGTIGSATDRGPVWPSLSLEANRYGDWHPMTGAARVRWDPRDTLRLDAELAREVVETPLAVSNRVTVDVAALGARWRWQPRSSVSATLAALEFDDGNLRTRLNLGADHTLRLNPKVVVGVEAMVFRSSDPTSELRPARGYWNPRDYREARAFVALEHEVDAWAFGVRLGVGTARERDGWGNRSSGDPNLWELSAGYDLAPSLRLRAWAGGSGGSMGVGSGGEGYWRRFAGIGITGWF